MRGATVQRAEKSDGGRIEPQSYDIFAPVVYVNQVGGRSIPEEVANRSISITMVRSGDATIPIIPDYGELREIRDELYTVKWLWMSNPKVLRFDEIYREALEELQSPEGIEIDGRKVRFSSRCRDILGTMYAAAKMCGNERAVLRYFSEMQDASASEDRDSDMGRAFAAMMEALRSQDEFALFRGREYELLTKVTTRSIARKFEELKALDGEIGQYERVKTIAVTELVKAMGFRLEKASHNTRTISPFRLRPTFMNALMKYGSEEQITAFGGEQAAARGPRWAAG